MHILDMPTNTNINLSGPVALIAFLLILGIALILAVPSLALLGWILVILAIVIIVIGILDLLS